ncbi:MAG: hypothetical protein NUV50_14225 [Rhodospirillales bacterium]|nr:hypothetical protein [Rhodospirillales bacterium]
MLSFFTLALLIGMSHALEADHVAAVSSMAARQSSVKSIMRLGAVWGLGHTLTLMTFAGLSVGLGLILSNGLAGWLEFGVGVMLVMLGGQVIFRLVRERIHFHVHHHAGAGGNAHFHAHSHLGEKIEAHNPKRHDHDHKAFPLRALAVGMMHGMAGSAALLMLSASTAPTPVMGLGYVAVFGLGSMLGMASLSAIIAVPLALSAQFLTWANRTIQGATGFATLGLGAVIMYETQLHALLGW